MPSNANDIITVQRGIIGGFDGDDLYIVGQDTMDANADALITDGQGNNTVHLLGGMNITMFRIAATTLELTLATGAVLTVLDSDELTFVTGGDPYQSGSGLTHTFASFVQDILGTSVPTSGIITGGPVSLLNDGSSSSGATVVYIDSAGETSMVSHNVRAVFAAGTYTHTLSGFSQSDVIDLPEEFLSAATIINQHPTDGLLTLQATNGAGAIMTINLTGVSTTADAQIFGVQSFTDVFGSESLI